MNCRICSHPISKDFIVDLHICLKCSHIFKITDVDPSAYESYASSAHLGLGTEKERYARFAARYRYRFLKFFKEKGKLLELGCGHKYFLEEASKDFAVEGTELSKILIQDIPEYKIHYGNPTEIKELGLYDAICGFHVLEHMNDPISEILELSRHLRDDGIFIFEIPAILFRGTELNAGEFYEHNHIHYFNQTSLNVFLNNCGLKLLLQTSFWDSPKREHTIFCAIKDNQLLTKRFDVYKYLSGGESI